MIKVYDNIFTEEQLERHLAFFANSVYRYDTDLTQTFVPRFISFFSEQDVVDLGFFADLEQSVAQEPVIDKRPALTFINHINPFDHYTAISYNNQDVLMYMPSASFDGTVSIRGEEVTDVEYKRNRLVHFSGDDAFSVASNFKDPSNTAFLAMFIFDRYNT